MNGSTLSRVRPSHIPALAAVADVVAVLVFAAAGRATHEGPQTAAGLLATAAPFLVGALLARAAPAVRTEPAAVRSGLVVLAVTAVVGLGLRALFLGRLPLSFAVVAVIALAVLVLGWRVVAAVVAGAVARRAPR